jgi:hypothetical protein
MKIQLLVGKTLVSSFSFPLFQIHSSSIGNVMSMVYCDVILFDIYVFAKAAATR